MNNLRINPLTNDQLVKLKALRKERHDPIYTKQAIVSLAVQKLFDAEMKANKGG